MVGRGLGGDVLRSAALGDPALVEHQHLVGQRQCVDRLVRDQDGDAVEGREVLGQLDPQRHRHGDVEPGERLVEQQQPRLGGEGARDRDALGLAAGQLSGFGGG